MPMIDLPAEPVSGAEVKSVCTRQRQSGKLIVIPKKV
jgi:hypothetical protein